MQLAPIPANEKERQAAVESLKILDTPNEEKFDRITRQATQEFNVPISTISIIDNDREWYKSKQGIKETQGRRDTSFCGHTIMGQDIYVIEDTQNDPRFVDNPAVKGPPHLKFYAGVTLREQKTNLPIGAFCIKDTVPHKLSHDEMNKLLIMAKKAENTMNGLSDVN